MVAKKGIIKPLKEKMKQQLFDNLTQEEIDEEIGREDKRLKNSRFPKKLFWILIALALTALLIIGYEIAPVARIGKPSYFLQNFFS